MQSGVFFMLPLFISFILPRFYGNPKFLDLICFRALFPWIAVLVIIIFIALRTLKRERSYGVKKKKKKG